MERAHAVIDSCPYRSDLLPGKIADALAAVRAETIERCFKATLLREGEVWSREALWAASMIRDRMLEGRALSPQPKPDTPSTGETE
jgi:hypothetical protein